MKPNASGLKPSTTFRNRKGETLFIDARKMGTLIDRVHRELTDADLEKIASTCHAWRGDLESPLSQVASAGQATGVPGNDTDVPGFCKTAASRARASPATGAGCLRDQHQDSWRLAFFAEGFVDVGAWSSTGSSKGDLDFPASNASPALPKVIKTLNYTVIDTA